MESSKRKSEQAREPELHQPDEAVVDLEPDDKDVDQVKGGAEYLKITMTDVLIS